jgi:hypothetical protein
MLVEKPVARTAAEARRVAREVDRSRTPAMAALHLRELPALGRLSGVLRERLLGRLAGATAVLAHPGAVDGWFDGPRAWMRDPARAGVGLAALWLWTIQLALNLAWSVVFFGRRSMGGGLAVIVPLWAAIAASAACAARVAPLASALLLPYLAWTGFACFLNFRVWQLNRRRLLRWPR